MAAAVTFPDGTRVAVAPGVLRSSAHLRTAAELAAGQPGAVVELAAADVLPEGRPPVGATLDDVRAFLAGERPAGPGGCIVHDFFVDEDADAGVPALAPGHLVRTVGLGPTEVRWVGADGAVFCVRGRADVTRIDPATLAVVDAHPTAWAPAGLFLPRSGDAGVDRELGFPPPGGMTVEALDGKQESRTVPVHVHGLWARHVGATTASFALFETAAPHPDAEGRGTGRRRFAVPLAALARILDTAPDGDPYAPPVELGGVAWELPRDAGVFVWDVAEAGVPLLGQRDGDRLRLAGHWDVAGVPGCREAGLVRGWRGAAWLVTDTGDVAVVTPEGLARTVAAGVAAGAAFAQLRAAALVAGDRLSVLLAHRADGGGAWRATVVGPVPLRTVAEPNHARADAARLALRWRGPPAGEEAVGLAAEALAAALADPDLVLLLDPTGQALAGAAAPAVLALARAAGGHPDPARRRGHGVADVWSLQRLAAVPAARPPRRAPVPGATHVVHATPVHGGAFLLRASVNEAANERTVVAAVDAHTAAVGWHAIPRAAVVALGPCGVVSLDGAAWDPSVALVRHAGNCHQTVAFHFTDGRYRLASLRAGADAVCEAPPGTPAAVPDSWDPARGMAPVDAEAGYLLLAEADGDQPGHRFALTDARGGGLRWRSAWLPREARAALVAGGNGATVILTGDRLVHVGADGAALLLDHQAGPLVPPIPRRPGADGAGPGVLALEHDDGRGTTVLVLAPGRLPLVTVVGPFRVGETEAEAYASALLTTGPAADPPRDPAAARAHVLGLCVRLLEAVASLPAAPGALAAAAATAAGPVWALRRHLERPATEEPAPPPTGLERARQQLAWGRFRPY